MTGFKTARLTRAEFDDARFQDWLGTTSPELFREYLRPSNEARCKLLSDRFHKLFASPDAEVRVCKRGQDYVSVIGFEHLNWDSQHFGVECGRLSPYSTSSDLSHAEQSEIHLLMLGLGIEWARHYNIKVLQRRLLSCRSCEINSLEDLGFHLVDNVVTLAAKLQQVISSTEAQPDSLTFRPPEREDLGALASMTRGAFPFSRFVNDRVLRADLGDDLYLKWLSTLFDDAIRCSGVDASAGRGIILAILKDKVVGYIAYRVDKALARLLGSCVATIELIVVDPAFQGMKIGQTLFREATRALQGLGADLIESSTWINQRVAMASNQNAGLRVRENLFTYHHYL